MTMPWSCYNETFVYFAKPVDMEGPYKIGCSEKPAMRLAKLMEWCPFPLEFAATAPGTFAEERRLFCKFREHRIHGEWFRAAPEIVAFVEGVRQTGKLPFDVLKTLSEARRPLLGLPVILERHSISMEDFLAAADTRRINVWRWVKEYPGAAAGAAVVALERLGYSYSIQDLFDAPETPLLSDAA